MPREGAGAEAGCVEEVGRDRPDWWVQRVGDHGKLTAVPSPEEVDAQPLQPTPRSVGCDHHCCGARHRERLATGRGAGVVDHGAGGEVGEAKHHRLRRVLDVEHPPRETRQPLWARRLDHDASTEGRREGTHAFVFEESLKVARSTAAACTTRAG